MHHWKATTKNVDAGEAAAFEDVGSPNRFEKSEAQKQIDPRRQIEGVPGEFGRESIRRIGHDRVATDRRQGQCYEIGNEMQREITVFDYIGCKDGVAAIAQHIDNGTTTGRWFPHDVWQILNSQQRLDRDRRRRITVVSALCE